MGCRSLIVYSDSQLLVRQVGGEYKVRDPRLKRLRDEAVELISRFHSFEIKHIPRELNSDANKLALKALAKALRGREE